MPLAACRGKALLEEIAKGWTFDERGQLPAVRALLSDLAALAWKGYGDDKAFFRKKLAKERKEVVKESYDLDQLQGDIGLQELRRDLRRFAIYEAGERRPHRPRGEEEPGALLQGAPSRSLPTRSTP